MDTERWLRVGEIFERLLEAPEGERQQCLSNLCGDDQQLRGIVLSMLDSHESPRFSDAAIKTCLDNSHGHGAPPHNETVPRDSEREGSRVGPWRLARRIGAGGMGVVWLADRADGQFKQRAALKLIKRGMDSEAVLARFLRERQILARLEHRNIAHLLDGGIAPDGRPYFAMEYVEGLPLLAYCDEHKLKLEDRLRLFQQVCAALRFAHAQHVVHRDIKPSNILVTADGSVKLLDFGIAKLLQGDDDLTSTLTGTQREQPMTPAYAAPEQIAGGEITQATDVYALGCVFYELLSGRRPHDFSAASDAHDVLKIILATDPVAPGRLRLAAAPVPSKRLRGDLDTIALTALKQIPARRYASVAAFAADIDNYLAGKPISARRDRVLYRSYKFLHRHRVGVAAIAAIAFVAVAGGALFWRERLARGFLGGNPTTAIVGFGNLSKDGDGDWVAPILQEQIANELAVSDKLRVLPTDLVHSETSDLPRPATNGYVQSGLDILRKRLDADFVLSGSYALSTQTGETVLRLDLALQDTRNGLVRAAFSDNAPVADLPGMIGRAGAELRWKLGANEVAPARLQEVAKARPATAEIGRHMGNALDAMRRSDPARAASELSEAIVLAPGYAPAYVQLARAWRMLGYDAKALAYAEKASASADGLPAAQRVQIERELAVQKGDWRRVLGFDAQMRAADAGNPDIVIATIRDMLDAGKPAVAESVLTSLRKQPGISDDPRVELAATWVADKKGDRKGQVEHALIALRQARARDERALAADALFNLGLAKDELGANTEAEDLMRKAIVEYRAIANPGYEADAHLNLANMLASQDRTREARDEYIESLKLYERIGNRRHLALVYGNLSIQHSNLADRDAADSAIASALRLSREIGDERVEAWIAGVSATNHLNESAGEDVLALFRSALDFAARTGAKRQHASILESYSELWRLRGSLADAKAMCAQALAEATQLAIPVRIMKTECECARIARDMGDVSEAKAAYGRAQALANSLGSVAIAGAVANDLAEYEIADGHWIDARERLAAVAKHLEVAELIGEEARTQVLLATAMTALGQNDARDAALNRARQLRSSITVQLVAFPIDIVLGQFPMSKDGMPIRTLDGLAAEANRRSWVMLAIEAQIAALRLAERTGDASAPTRRSQILAAARARHFGWVLSRLENAPKHS